MALKKPGGVVSVKAHLDALRLTGFGKKHGELVEMLGAVEYEGGEARTTSTLTIFVEDGFVKLCLNDRDNERTAWIADETLEGALAALESKLRSGLVEWRRSYQAKGRTAKK